MVCYDRVVRGLSDRLKAKLPKDYSEQTYASPYAIVRHAHQARLSVVVDYLLSKQPRRILDYGAGDGQMIVEAISRGLRPESIVAYEPVQQFVDMLRVKLEDHDLNSAVEVVTERSQLDTQEFDCIACMEVLEHMPLNERESFYALCEDTLSSEGVAMVAVPVEFGPTLLIKNLGRTLLKGRAPEYSARELLKLSLGSKFYDPERFDPSNDATWIQDHRGFDYRLLRDEMGYRFTIEQQVPTPITWVPPPLGNQGVLFVVSLRDDPRPTQARHPQ